MPNTIHFLGIEEWANRSEKGKFRSCYFLKLLLFYLQYHLCYTNNSFLTFIQSIRIKFELVKMDLERCNRTKNILCNVCGLYTPKNKQRCFTNLVIEKYKHYYQRCPQIDEDFAPRHLCVCCHSMLLKGGKRSILAMPMIWTAPDVAHMYCYSCLMPSLVGKKWSHRKQIKYPDSSSSILPDDSVAKGQIDVPEEELPVTASFPTMDTDSSYHPQPSTSAGYFIYLTLFGRTFNNIFKSTIFR